MPLSMSIWGRAVVALFLVFLLSFVHCAHRFFIVHVPCKYLVTHPPLSAGGDGSGEQSSRSACPVWLLMGVCPHLCGPPPASVPLLWHPLFLVLASTDFAL